MLSYCKKCGRTLYNPSKPTTKCDVCGSTTCEVPNEYTDNSRWSNGDGKQALIEEFVKTSPEFDQYLFEHRVEILTKQVAEYEVAMTHGKTFPEK